MWGWPMMWMEVMIVKKELHYFGQDRLSQVDRSLWRSRHASGNTTEVSNKCCDPIWSKNKQTKEKKNQTSLAQCTQIASDTHKKKNRGNFKRNKNTDMSIRKILKPLQSFGLCNFQCFQQPTVLTETCVTKPTHEKQTRTLRDLVNIHRHPFRSAQFCIHHFYQESPSIRIEFLLGNP